MPPTWFLVAAAIVMCVWCAAMGYGRVALRISMPGHATLHEDVLFVSYGIGVTCLASFGLFIAAGWGLLLGIVLAVAFHNQGLQLGERNKAAWLLGDDPNGAN